MKRERFYIYIYVILMLFPLLFCTCKSIEMPGKDIDTKTIINKTGNSIPDSTKGLLVFHENFQNWYREGYLSPTKQDCETDLMTSSGIVSFIPAQVAVIYDSLKVNYSLIDYAVNPECGNREGSSTETSEISKGYVALQCPVHYTCGHYSKGCLDASNLPSVSYIEFTVSYGDYSTDNYAAGVSLWRKADTDVDTIKIGTYIPTNPLQGEKFTVKINSKNVFLRFKAEKNSIVPIVMESNINRSVRIHDLYIWKPKN